MHRSLTEPPTAPGEPWWQRLHPLRHFAAALGWAIFVLVVAGSWVAAEWSAGIAEHHVAASAHARLVRTANQAADALLAQVQIRLAVMEAVAGQWAVPQAGEPTPLQVRLAALQARQPELGWMGVLGADGRWLAMSDDWPDAAALPGQAWLAAASSRGVVALHRGVARGGQDDALMFAVPLAADGAPAAGVLVAQLPWLWLQAQLDAHLRVMGADNHFELMLLGPGGSLLAGSHTVRGRPAGYDWSEGGRYLVAQAGEFFSAMAVHSEKNGLGHAWQLSVRESAEQALEPARNTHRVVLTGVLAVGLLAALAAVLVARHLLGRLRALARQAREVHQGRRTAIDIPPGQDEVHEIGVTLAELIGGLQQEKAQLAQLNAGLEERVRSRTERIARMAEDARHAAVTRERLRLARGLHDTLAHSLVALLTQIRLLRKLGPRWSREQLDAELAQTELVATEGLAEVRAAIGRMRASGVHDSGLGPELQDMLQRFAERSGVAVEAEIDAAAADLVNERAATVFSIAREALRNAERHAGARQVRLQLRPEPAPEADSDAPATWLLVLADDGRGFDTGAPHAGHYGLVGLREQAAQIGAQLSIASAPGQGCRVGLRFTA